MITVCSGTESCERFKYLWNWKLFHIVFNLINQNDFLLLSGFDFPGRVLFSYRIANEKT